LAAGLCPDPLGELLLRGGEGDRKKGRGEGGREEGGERAGEGPMSLSPPP